MHADNYAGGIMRFENNAVTISSCLSVQAIDPGAVYTGIVSALGIYIDDVSLYKTKTTLTTEDLLKTRFNPEDTCAVQIFEAPFFKTNAATLGHTWMVIGRLWQPEAKHIFVTPQQGNKFLGLDHASTHDIAKMNVSEANGWGFRTPHEVSAYAALHAAIAAGKLIIND